MFSFTQDQTFIVTGASSGIGYATAYELNRLGATVIAIGRNQDKLINLQNTVKFSKNLKPETKNLNENINSLPLYIKSLKEKYGKFHGMAFCAGVANVSPLQLLTLDEIQHVYNINLFAPILMTKGISDKRNNIGKGTSIVHISSLATKTCNRAHSTYTGSKAALNASMSSIAKELAPRGVRVNCVLPADIDTPMLDKDGPLAESTKARLDKYPMGVGSVEDVANVIVFLLSEKAKWITGQQYVVDCASV